MNLLLKDLAWGSDQVGDIRLRRGRISELGRGLGQRRGERALSLKGCRAFPGLVNAHDHLGLDLLPHLGNPPYPSLYHFAEEIYLPKESPIREVLLAKTSDRFTWGAYRNLIAGVTRVIHHDPLPRRLFLGRGLPVRVLRRFGWSHSLRFTKDPVADYRAAAGKPFIVHAAEGVDEASHTEIDQLQTLGILGSRTVIVHGIALTSPQQSLLAAVDASLVWCPASNLRLYQRTAPIRQLLGRVRVALGTDSTLTGSPTLLDEMRVAAESCLALPEEILKMVTVTPCDVFGLAETGRIETGGIADLVVVPESERKAAETLLATSPSEVMLVVVGGEVRMSRPQFVGALNLGQPNCLIEGRQRWLWGDPGGLCRRLLARVGRETLERNSVWPMIQPLPR